MATLSVIGIGPGDPALMTEACRRSLAASDIIAGFSTYIDLVRDLCPGKTFLATGMKDEVERCRKSLALAAEGKSVALVSSGDSGIYGMASLVFQLAPDFPGVEIQVIPGVTAASSGGALLGAPLGHDFAVISLSDLLTPWPVIERRLRSAAEGDFAICLYNPASRRRPDYLRRACAILLETLPPDRPCGIARNIGRDGEAVAITTLGELGAAGMEKEVDMFSTVFIGSAGTRVIAGKLVTPRGYREWM